MAENKIVDINKVNLLDDELFKEILGRDGGYDFICEFMEAFYGYEKDSLKGELKLVPQGSIPADVYRLKAMTGDMLIYFKNKYIDIEVYTSFNKYKRNKSATYMIRLSAYMVGRGQDYNDIKELVQINLASNIAENIKPNGIQVEKFLDLLTFYLIDVDNLEALQYNNTRSKDFIKYIGFMLADRKGRALLAKGDVTLMKVNDEIEQFINSEEYINNLSRRARDLQCEREEALDEGRTEGIELGRTEGIELGQNQGEESKEREIVMNMFNEDFTLEQISAATKLSLDEINTIIDDSKK